MTGNAPSLLDRFIGSGSLTPEQYRESVFRDLLWLLNTRRSVNVEPDAELTVLDYGLPDGNDTDLAGELGRTIAAFEPRLKNVSVRSVDLSGTSPERFFRDRPGTANEFSANPFLGIRSATDVFGRDIASVKFRAGISIEAELHGLGEGFLVTFGVVQDEDGCFYSE
ncbi:MAG: GPW/gp25 family protein [Planctomycetaceae bacterium]|nr:GPW/gp25 family protein [Planctomycetaceae bacterium]